MNRIIRSRPLVVFAIVTLVLLACLIIGLRWYFFPQHDSDIAHIIGIRVWVVVLFFLIASFGYLLFKNSHRVLILFVIIAVFEVAYGTVLLYRVVTTQMHQYQQQVVDQTKALVALHDNSKLADIRNIVDQEDNVVASIMIFAGVLMTFLVLMATSIMLLMQRHANRFKLANYKLKQEMLEREKAESARAAMKMALLQSQKLEAVGTLAGGIAHNFNNILYSIQGYVQMARDDADKESVSYRNLGKVLEATKCGKDLVSGILSFSRNDNYDFDVISIKEVLVSSIDLLKAALPATVDFKVSLEVDEVDVLGNHAQLQQVVMNIVRNAVDAMHEVGTICLSANVSMLNEELLTECPGLIYPAYVVIRIADDGVGMDEETKLRIFEPFFTTKDVGEGTGLGLATSRSILEDHKGVIVVDSVIGKGSTFNIYIPRYQDK